jgi:hypothetical protein
MAAFRILPLLATALVVGCAAPGPAAGAAAQPKETLPVKPVETAPGGVADLPYARGRTFATLDEYLAYRQGLGAQDVPWYREVAPGVYEVAGRRARDTVPQTVTRRELLEKFGFRE